MWDTFLPRRKPLHQVALSGRVLDTIVAWVVIAVTTASGEEVSDFMALHHGAYLCSDSKRTLSCDATGQTKISVLQSSKWDNMDEVIIIGARSLNIEEQCNATEKLVNIIASENVKTSTRVFDDTCVVRLHLTNSSATAITSVASLLKIINSKVVLISRDPVEQFDISRSTVLDLSVRATATRCEIIDSTVKILRRVVLDGTFTFKVQNSDIGNIKHLNYKSSADNSEIVNVTVGKVESEGLVVRSGALTLREVVIGSLPAGAIIVQGGAKLRVEDTHITNAEIDSIVIESGTIELLRVTIGSQVNVSFTIKDTGGGIRPFALIFSPSPITKWIVTGICIGLVIGILIGGALGFYIFNRANKFVASAHDGMELLQTDNPSAAGTESSQGPPLIVSQGPAPHHQKKIDNDDDFYTDVGNNETSSSSINNELNNSYTPLPTHRPPPSIPMSGPPPPSSYPPPPTSHPPPPTSHPPPPTSHPPPPTSHPPPPTSHPPLSAANQPPPPSNVANTSSNPLAPSRVPPLPPVRRDSAINASSSSFSEERDTFTRQLGIMEDDQDFYDELEESQQMPRPPIPSNKPSFLHTPLKPSQLLQTTTSNHKIPTSSGPTVGLKVAGGRQWPPPKPQLPSKPPPSETKPSGSTFSADDDDEDIYETIEEP